MLLKCEKHYKKIVFSLFVLMILIGVICVRSYGIPWDEWEEIKILASDAKEYAKLIGGENNSFVQEMNEKGIVDIASNENRDHGAAAYYPVFPFLLANGENARGVMFTWHFYTYCLFMLGIISIYFIVKRLLGNWKYGILAGALIYLSPRFFAEGFYNNKDIVLFTLSLFVIWFGILMLETKQFRYAAFFGIAGAFAGHTRILGFLIFGLFGLGYIIKLTIEKTWNKKNFYVGVTALCSMVLCFYIITPAMWYNPLDFFSYYIGTSINFYRWNGTILYQGNIFHRDINPLPWHYLPVIFAITTPILIVVLTILGNIATMIQSIRERGKQYWLGKGLYNGIFFLYIWIPLGYAMICRPTIYNGWRHFYFLYGPMIILAVTVLRWFIEHKNKWIKYLSGCLVGIQLLSMIIVLFCNHPYQYAYYNVLAGGQAEERYEYDYWNVSVANCLIHMVEAKPEISKFRISAWDWASYDGLCKGYEVVPDDVRAKIEIINYNHDPNQADYFITNQVYRRINEVALEQGIELEPIYDFESYCEKVTAAECSGVDIMTVYRKR